MLENGLLYCWEDGISDSREVLCGLVVALTSLLIHGACTMSVNLTIYTAVLQLGGYGQSNGFHKICN